MDYYGNNLYGNYGGYGYGNNMMGGYYPNMGTPIVYNQMPQSLPNALNDDEIKSLRGRRGPAISLAVDPLDFTASMCTHRENGRDVVVQLQGTDEVYCPICGEQWDPNPITEEEASDLVKKLVDQFQNMKWIGNLPVNVIREYCQMLPLIKKFPDLYKYAVKQFDSYTNQAAFMNANEAGIYNQYNSLMNPAYGMMGGYQMPQMGYGAPVQQANPYVNPMQAPIAGQPQQQPVQQQPVGYVPAAVQAPSQPYPFQQPMQAPIMPQMGYGQPVPAPTGYPQYSPVFQPQQQQVAAPEAEQKTETKEETVNL